MKRLTIICMALALVGLPAWAQKIETQKPDRNRIIHVQTALNHLTVIEVGEPVTIVAAGSSAFKIEWRENKVFVQPIEASAATNLFIWTVSGRLNYELEPAGAVEQMDFAIDQPPVQADSKPAATAKPPSSPVTPVISTNTLLGGRPVWINGLKEPKNRVVVLLKDVFQCENEVFIRYAVRNGGKESYALSTPQVFKFDVQSLPKSLDGLSNTQLTDKEVAQLKSSGHSQVEVVGGEARSTRVAPGDETVARNRYHFTNFQIEETLSYLVIGAVSVGVGAWLLATRRSRREKEWPHPPLVISPKRDKRFAQQAWSRDSVVLGYDIHGAPWFWPDKVRVMQGIVLGMTGAGKTTLLRNIITQDLARVVGPPGEPHYIPMVIFDGKGDLHFFHDLLPHIHRAGRLHQLRVLIPARPDTIFVVVIRVVASCTD